MGTSMRVVVLVLVLGCMVAASFQAGAAEMKDEPGGIAVMAMKASATVESVDKAKREVTLKMPSGETKMFKAGKEMVNFDQIKAGDKVNATLIEELAVSVRKAGAPAGAGDKAVVALAPKGAMPGMVMANTTEVTAKVDEVEKMRHALKLDLPDGKKKTLKVARSVSLEDVKKGDDIVVRHTEALALMVEKP